MTPGLKIPFHRPSIGELEINEVVDTLRSGWLTTGAKTKLFEKNFAAYVGAKHAVAVNSATAALHIGLEACGVRKGDSVLVPTMTFAATAEVVRYFDAKPVLVDCRPEDCNIDVEAAYVAANAAVARGERLRAIIPVHYGGQPVDVTGVRRLAQEFDLRIVEDAAHCCPAHYRTGEAEPWRFVGAESDVCCYSFYANKCITTGEGGMACTNDDQLAERMRVMSLHGISKDAWQRFTAQGSWYYEIVAPGYKYNLTDIASAIGIHQLRQADAFRDEREAIAQQYSFGLADIPQLNLPTVAPHRRHSWHLYVIRLRENSVTIDRGAVIDKLKAAGIGTSVHWIPLHMHPYYRQTYGYRPGDFPVAECLSRQVISLPIYPGMSRSEVEYVVGVLRVTIMAASK